MFGCKAICFCSLYTHTYIHTPVLSLQNLQNFSVKFVAMLIKWACSNLPIQKGRLSHYLFIIKLRGVLVMSKLIKISALVAALVLSGCAVESGNSRGAKAEAKGENAGNLVVFSAESLGRDTVAISVNNHFIAPLQANKQFKQGLCSGNYKLTARSIQPVMLDNNVVRVTETQQIQVKPKSTTYVELSRGKNGWALETVSQETWKAKTSSLAFTSTDSKIVRRVTADLINCK